MATNCVVCKVPLDGSLEFIRCSKQQCGNSYHVTCVPEQSVGESKKSGSKIESWVCPICDHVGQPQSQDSFVDEVLTRSSLNEILNEVKSTTSVKIDNSIKEISELRNSVLVLSRYVDEVKNTATQLEEEVDRLQLENSRLQTKNGSIWRSIVRLGDELSEIQEYRVNKVIQSREELVQKKMRGGLLIAFMFCYAVVGAGFFWMVTRLIKKNSIKRMNDLKNEFEE